MTKLDFEVLDKEKKKKILKNLEVYGIENLPYLIIKWGKRFRIFTGSIDKESIFTLFKELNVDSIGLYFASDEKGFRLSTDAMHLLSSQIKNGIIEVDEEQAEQWFLGNEILLNEEQKKEAESFNGEFLILRNKEDLIGVGKKSLKGIANFLPKERRVKQ